MLVIVGVAIALPIAHATSLHAPHVSNGDNPVDRHCSLATCGAFGLAAMPLMSVLISLVLSLMDLHVALALLKPVILDPPPRCLSA